MSIFDEDYFVNTIAELLDNNIDSIKLYSSIDSLNIHPEPFYKYTIKKYEDRTYITRKSVHSFFDQDLVSIQTFQLNKFLEIEEVLATGVQDGVLLNNIIINRKIIDFGEGKIITITSISNNFSDTIVTNFNYFEDLVWKVDIQNNRKVKGEKRLTNRIIYIEYFRNGEVLKTIKNGNVPNN